MSQIPDSDFRHHCHPAHAYAFLDPVLFNLNLLSHQIPLFIMSSYTIRPALVTDIPSITRIDSEVNANAPIAKIPWARPEDFIAGLQDRYEWFFRRPDFRGLVACTPSEKPEDGEKVVGYLFWKRPKKEGEELKDWEPNMPEGTNLKFLAMYLSAMEGGKKGYDIDRLFGRFSFSPTAIYLADENIELEVLAVSADHERRGIASAMIRLLLEDVDRDDTGVFVRSSTAGRRLYEKFRWKVVGESRIDLKEYGLEKPKVNYIMLRDSVTKVEAGL